MCWNRSADATRSVFRSSALGRDAFRHSTETHRGHGPLLQSMRALRLRRSAPWARCLPVIPCKSIAGMARSCRDARSIDLPQHLEPYPCPRAAIGQRGELVLARVAEVLLEGLGTARLRDPATVQQPLHAGVGTEHAQLQAYAALAARRTRERGKVVEPIDAQFFGRIATVGLAIGRQRRQAGGVPLAGGQPRRCQRGPARDFRGPCVMHTGAFAGKP